MTENQKINQIKSFIVENKWVVGIAVVVLAVFVALALIHKPQLNSEKIVEGCMSGDAFSQTTGKPCKEEALGACKDGDIFDRNTGKYCPGMENKNDTSKTSTPN